MNLEDYPVILFKGRRLHVLPELPQADHRAPRCVGCYAYVGSMESRPECDSLRRKAKERGYNCDPPAGADMEPLVFVPPENFQEYIVEFVRRRVG
jgi:hypothetical protein